ncbi:DUF5074 domain-containing protein [Myroides marinus]|uniref:DUF5074 domain-containing protein n=1 Tax=Myroides marinus TaxID=703342 RepID=UPI002578FCA6|nr:DUF5074 domain-containing protein [Myroides marinus]MDM1378419.1 DUF5074 domain-containing protein [Myroides marinus]MDM1385547.1 DUF5074 domain-containing protein [Myroides marinus]MDM1392903.1 DUF5074 domain-containing protein [Myroides marinus]
MKKTILTRSLVFSLLAFTIACSSNDDNQNENGFKIIPPSQPSPLIQPSGFYIANEDWYSHDKGTINFLDYGLNRKYRIYREANNNKDSLGATTTMGVAFGENYYLVSKQFERFVVTDKNFKKVKVFSDINGDGRSFVGVSDTKGYISTQNGITIYHINSKSIGQNIAGINSQTGNMVYVDGKVYASVQGVGLVIINTDTDMVIGTKPGKYNQVTLDKNGIVWAGKGKEIERINPKDDKDIKTYPITNAPIEGKWGAWSPGSMSPSMKEDAIYWIANDGAWNGGNKVVKFNTQTGELNSDFYTLGQDDMGNKLEFYGAGLRVDPVKDDLVLAIKRSGWGSNPSYNWTRIVSNTGALKGQVFMEGGTVNEAKGYYWFPSIPFFQDNNAPEILVNQIVLKANKEFRVALKDIVVDQDSPYALIEKSVKNLENEFGYATIEGDELVLKPSSKIGKTAMSMTVISNGKKVQKNVEVWVRE